MQARGRARAGTRPRAWSPVHAFDEEARHCQGRSEELSDDGMFDRASIRTRWSSLRTRCSMKFDLAALLSLSRPLRAGRGFAVAANSVCPCTAAVPPSCFDATFLLASFGPPCFRSRLPFSLSKTLYRLQDSLPSPRLSTVSKTHPAEASLPLANSPRKTARSPHPAATARAVTRPVCAPPPRSAAARPAAIRSGRQSGGLFRPGERFCFGCGRAWPAAHFGSTRHPASCVPLAPPEIGHIYHGLLGYNLYNQEKLAGIALARFWVPLFECAGEMAEWLKAHAWKACVGVTLPRVRIPLSPPLFHL